MYFPSLTLLVLCVVMYAKWSNTIRYTTFRQMILTQDIIILIKINEIYNL